MTADTAPTASTAAVPDPADVEKAAAVTVQPVDSALRCPICWARCTSKLDLGIHVADEHRHAAVRPSPDSEADRLRAAMRDLADELKRDAYGPFGSYDESYAYAADRIRAALGTGDREGADRG